MRRRNLPALLLAVAIPVVVAIVATPLSSGLEAENVCVTEIGGVVEGFPGGLATGEDGALWFSEQIDDRIGFYNPDTDESGAVDLPPGTAPHFVTSGPDGNIWFTGLGGFVGTYDLGRREVTLLSEGISRASVPHAIVSGPDGNLYFTQQEEGRLGRVDPDTQEIERFGRGLPPVNRMHGITVDPDGEHLWVALQNADALARFNIARERFDELVPFSEESGPHDVRVGPDGERLYVTLQYASKVGEYDLDSGDVREYETPLPPPGTTDLEIGPKLIDIIPSSKGGAMLISTFAADRLYRFDTESKRITEVTCGITPNSGVLELAVGPDERIWFTEPLGRRLGRVNE
jgi:streptogramin lyase